MTEHIDAKTEKVLLHKYLESLPNRVSRTGDHLLHTCAEFHVLHPEESVLAYTHSTEWIRPWRQTAANHLTPSQAASRIFALGSWWSWLFEHKLIDDNVLSCFYPFTRVLHDSVPLVLHHNLQRSIASYIAERGPRRRESRRKLSRLLTNFNVFAHRASAEGNNEFRIDEELIIDWLRNLSESKGLHALGLDAGKMKGFLQFLVDTGQISDNPLASLRAKYAARDRKEFLSGLLGLNNAPPLTEATAKPRFVSPLASHLEAFVSLKRAMGRRYVSPEKDLRTFDRFVGNFPVQTTYVTRELVHAWFRSLSHLHPRTRKQRLRLIRQFCQYLVRFDHRTYVPEQKIGPVCVPQFKPHIYSVEEYRAILKAALRMPSPRAELRPKALYTILLILYGTGLRIGEALRLRIRDVDLSHDTLLIRDTKFFKSRIVPISESLSRVIRDYLVERLLAAPSPNAFLFLNHDGRRYSSNTFGQYFARLLAVVGIQGSQGHRRPRVYDVRHTFAVNRLLRWYRDGEDLLCKLPQLATYMGHVSVLSTQDYLNATAELLTEASEKFRSACGSLIKTSGKESNDEIR